MAERNSFAGADAYRAFPRTRAIATAPVADAGVARTRRSVKFAQALCTFGLVAMFASVAGAAPAARVPPDELVVLGRVTTVKYDASDDLGWEGQIMARLKITRVIRGRPPSPVLTIKYIAHADFVRNRVFRFHLQRAKDGIWLACNDGGGRGYVCR